MADEPLLERARAALAQIRLPDGGTLGGSDRLGGPVLTQGRLSATIAMDPSESAAFEPVRAAAQAALRALPDGGDALVVLTSQSPGPPRLDRGPTSRPSEGRRPNLAGIRHIIAVASGKGGVGKSTTAANLAIALRGLGLRVGLLDADIHGPSVHVLLGIHARPRVTPARRLIPVEAHGIVAMSMGLLVDAETAMIWRGPMVQSALNQLLGEVEWGPLDVMVIDMPPGTGDAQLAIAQEARPSGAVIVSTPQDLALIDARRGIAMFRKSGVPILGIIQNMSHFVCPDCGSEHPLFGRGGARDEARRLGVPWLGDVPLTMALRESGDAGRPITALAPDSAVGQTYREIAAGVLAALDAVRAPADPERSE